MKKTIFILVAVYVMTLPGAFETKAQLVATPVKMESMPGHFAKSDPVIITNPKIILPENVPSRALKDFRKNFQVDNETWYETNEGFTCEFSKDLEYTRVYYSRKGYWTVLMKSYFEKNLDKDIRKRVKREYFDHDILRIHEIQLNDSGTDPVYLILIRHEHDGKWLRVSSQGMEIYQELNYTG